MRVNKDKNTYIGQIKIYLAVNSPTFYSKNLKS